MMVDNERAGSPQRMTSIFLSDFERKLTRNFPLLVKGAACSACYLVSSQLEGSRLVQWKFLLDWLQNFREELLANELHWKVLFFCSKTRCRRVEPISIHFRMSQKKKQPQLDLHIKVLLVFFDRLALPPSALWDALNPCWNLTQTNDRTTKR